jgi:hypothetical protein
VQLLLAVDVCVQIAEFRVKLLLAVDACGCVWMQIASCWMWMFVEVMCLCRVVQLLLAADV